MQSVHAFQKQVRRGVARRFARVKHFVGLILFLFVSPIAILYFGIIPFSARLWILGLYVIAVSIIVFRQERSWRSLGMRSDNIRALTLPYTIFTLVSVCLLLVFAHILGKEPTPGWTNNSSLLFLFIPISFTQEFLYRSFLMTELRKFYTSIISVIIVNSLLFTFLHVIYGEPFITLPLALVAGVGFSYMYYKYPNLWLIALSHSILNFVAVLYSFF